MKARSSSLYLVENMNPSQEVSVTIDDSSTSQTRARRAKTLTEEVRGELREIFDLYMDLETFRVSSRQLQEMMRVYGYHPRPQEFERVLKIYNIRRKDQCITYDLFEKIMAKLIMQRDAANGIMKAFELFDIHNDGCITFTSLCEINRLLGDNFSDDDVLEMIVEADLDRDGVVDLKDFTAMMKLTDIEW